MTFIQNWPEGLFVLLVMIAPVGVANVMWRQTILGYWAVLGLGMIVGLVVWFVCVWAFVLLSERADRTKHEDAN